MRKLILRLFKSSQLRILTFYLLISYVLKPVDVLLRFLKKKKITKEEPLMIFIIGLPRSGSTILYQYLANTLNVTFISNLWTLLPKSGPYLRRLLHLTPPAETSSFYGNGKYLNSTQEGGKIFDKWFKSEKQHYFEKIEQDKYESLRSYFSNAYMTSRRPLLIKNGRNAVRLKVLKKAFPNAYFIRLNRSPLDIAQSIYQGRMKIYGSENRNWTVKPKEWDEIKLLNVSEQIAAQVYYLEKNIQAEFRDIPSERIIDIKYTDFCNQPADLIYLLEKKIPNLKVRKAISTEWMEKKFKVSKGIKIPKTVYLQVEKELENLYGRN